MRNQALVRVLRLAERLRGGRMTLHELAREFRVHARTIRRDLEALAAAGVSVQSHTQDDGSPSVFWVQR